MWTGSGALTRRLQARSRIVMVAQPDSARPLFHFGILLVIFGHIGCVLVPESATRAVGISETAYHAATATLGTTNQKPSWPTRLTPQPAVAIEHPRQYLGLDCVGNHPNADTDAAADSIDGTPRWGNVGEGSHQGQLLGTGEWRLSGRARGERPRW